MLSYSSWGKQGASEMWLAKFYTHCKQDKKICAMSLTGLLLDYKFCAQSQTLHRHRPFIKLCIQLYPIHLFRMFPVELLILLSFSLGSLNWQQKKKNNKRHPLSVYILKAISWSTFEFLSLNTSSEFYDSSSLVLSMLRIKMNHSSI